MARYKILETRTATTASLGPNLYSLIHGEAINSASSVAQAYRNARRMDREERNRIQNIAVASHHVLQPARLTPQSRAAATPGVLIASGRFLLTDETASASLNTFTTHDASQTVPKPSNGFVTVFATYEFTPDDSSGNTTGKQITAHLSISLTGNTADFVTTPDIDDIECGDGTFRRQVSPIVIPFRVRGNCTGDILLRGQFNHTGGGNGNQLNARDGIIQAQVFSGII